MGSSGNETVSSALRDVVMPCACAKGEENVKVKILDGVSGVLKPGRLTLVLGPPGSGKSVFMQTLSGRMVKGVICALMGLSGTMVRILTILWCSGRRGMSISTTATSRI